MIPSDGYPGGGHESIAAGVLAAQHHLALFTVLIVAAVVFEIRRRRLRQA